jgi:Tol biopolymer transport system component/DNA-binding winged helix-turn-helix (wHTH) protein
VSNSELGRENLESGDYPRLIRFGPFEADLETMELRKDGAKLALQVQPFQVLAILLKHPGELVTREQLRAKVWPEDTFVDFDPALNTAITKIRLALGDNAERPIFIETLPRRGYRFMGKIQTPHTDADAVDDGKPAWRRKALWIGVGTAVVLCAFIVLWKTARNHNQRPAPALEVVPFLSLHGFQGYPAFSPDGNQIAFARYEGEDEAIYTALIGGDTPLRLTTKPGVCCPTWSPDNRQIAFMRFVNNGFSINVISALGGSEKTLYTSQFAEHLRFPGRMCDHMDWSPDGKWLAFGGPTDVDYKGISLLSLDDLKVKWVTSPKSPDYDCEPAFSPDGLSLAFERGSTSGMGRDLFVAAIGGGEPRRLTFENAWGGVPVWTQDGTEIVFPSTRGGLLNLWRIPVTGGSPQAVAGIGPVAFAPSIPRRGNLLAYVHPTVSNSIWQLRLSDETHPVGTPTRFITSRGAVNWRPNFSPDGKKVVFESDRLGYSDIWYCDSDGSNCAQLTSLHGTAGTARWSPDGQHIVFEVQLQHFYEIYVLDMPSRRPHLLPTFPNTDNGAPNWSRDGKWIYFYSTNEKGLHQLWKIPYQGGARVQVTKTSGIYAMESENGRSLYFAKDNQPGIWRMPVNGGDEERVVDQPQGWAVWSLAPRGIYYLHRTQNEKGTIEFFDFATHKRTAMADVDKPTPGLALSPDGRSLLFTRNEFEDYEIMLVKNFH